MSVNEYHNGDQIIIYGAGIFGEIAYRGLEFLKIPVLFFCDRNMEGEKRFDTDVISPESLSEFLQAKIIVASQNYFKEMVNYLERIGFEICYDIRDFFEIPLNKDVLSGNARDVFENPEKYRDAVAYSCLSGEDIYIPHLEVIVTERCTLKCKKCATMTPYYGNPKNIYLSDCLKGIERFVSAVTYISEIRLLGGEPFINKGIDEFVIKLSNYSKIGIVHIYTNGTILPSPEILDALRNKKVHIHISNYAINSEKVEKLIELFQKEKILYTERKYDSWTDLGEVEFKNYSANQRKKIFRNCLAKNCFTLNRNKLFRCSRVANMYNIGNYKNIEYEYVDLEDMSKTDSEIKRDIKQLLFEIEDLEACDYCNGMDLFHNIIPVAEQLS